jgi:hypothetical protein
MRLIEMASLQQNLPIYDGVRDAMQQATTNMHNDRFVKRPLQPHSLTIPRINTPVTLVTAPH